MPKRADDPDRLIRESAGRYGTGDERFVVEQESPGAWYVADALQADELGLPLLRGPFATLAEARSAVADARRSPAPVSTPRVKPARKQAPKSPPKPAPTPRTWLDDLSSERRNDAQRLIRDLASLGVDDAEALVRRELGSEAPVITPALLRHALSARLGGDADVDSIMEVLAGEGFDKDRGRPARGWRLVELDERGRPTGREIARSPKR